ncbi:hypothetical protein HYV86_01215 [Candidatus Woesearchaeota archaeon]|nr:hypothetical protein [Candidatus Woesearchaeota archaeon]
MNNIDLQRVPAALAAQLDLGASGLAREYYSMISVIERAYLSLSPEFELDLKIGPKTPYTGRMQDRVDFSKIVLGVSSYQEFLEEKIREYYQQVTSGNIVVNREKYTLAVRAGFSTNRNGISHSDVSDLLYHDMANGLDFSVSLLKAGVTECAQARPFGRINHRQFIGIYTTLVAELCGPAKKTLQTRLIETLARTWPAWERPNDDLM